MNFGLIAESPQRRFRWRQIYRRRWRVHLAARFPRHGLLADCSTVTFHFGVKFAHSQNSSLCSGPLWLAHARKSQSSLSNNVALPHRRGTYAVAGMQVTDSFSKEKKENFRQVRPCTLGFERITNVEWAPTKSPGSGLHFARPKYPRLHREIRPALERAGRLVETGVLRNRLYLQATSGCLESGSQGLRFLNH